MNPNKAFQNRTARLVREATTPVYTTATPAPAQREHIIACEVATDSGRYWRTMPESEVSDFWANLPASYDASDEDHSTECWCFKGRV